MYRIIAKTTQTEVKMVKTKCGISLTAEPGLSLKVSDHTTALALGNSVSVA